MEANYDIGTWVMCFDDDDFYDRYTNFFNQTDELKQIAPLFDYGKTPLDWPLKIIAKHNHSRNNTLVYVLQDEKSNVYLNALKNKEIFTILNKEYITLFNIFIKSKDRKNYSIMDHFLSGDTIIQCDTKEMARQFLAEAHAMGCKWNSGYSLIDISHTDSKMPIYYFYNPQLNAVTYGTYIENDDSRIVIKFRN